MNRLLQGWVFIVIQLLLMVALEWSGIAGLSVLEHMFFFTISLISCLALLKLDKKMAASAMAICWVSISLISIFNNKIPLEWLDGKLVAFVGLILIITQFAFWGGWITSLYFVVQRIFQGRVKVTERPE